MKLIKKILQLSFIIACFSQASTAYSQNFSISAESDLPTSVVAGSTTSINFIVKNNTNGHMRGPLVRNLPYAGMNPVHNSCQQTGLPPKQTCVLTLQLIAPQNPGSLFSNGNFRLCFQNSGFCNNTQFTAWNMNVISSNNYIATAHSLGNGQIAPPSQIYTIGSTTSLTYNLIPDPNYTIGTVTDTCNNGSSGGAMSGNNYIVRTVSQNCLITAYFKPVTPPPSIVIDHITAFVAGSPESRTNARGPLSGDTGVWLVGKNFPVGTSVKLYFGDQEANNVRVDSDTIITANTPANNTVGDVDVRLTTQDGSPLASLTKAYYYRLPKCTLGGTANVTYCQAQIRACIYVPSTPTTSLINVTGKLITNSNFTPPQCVDAIPKFETIEIPEDAIFPNVFCTQAHSFLADRQTGEACSALASNNASVMNLTMLNVEYSDATGNNINTDKSVVIPFTSPLLLILI